MRRPFSQNSPESPSAVELDATTLPPSFSAAARRSTSTEYEPGEASEEAEALKPLPERDVEKFSKSDPSASPSSASWNVVTLFWKLSQVAERVWMLAICCSSRDAGRRSSCMSWSTMSRHWMPLASPLKVAIGSVDMLGAAPEASGYTPVSEDRPDQPGLEPRPAPNEAGAGPEGPTPVPS